MQDRTLIAEAKRLVGWAGRGTPSSTAGGSSIESERLSSKSTSRAQYSMRLRAQMRRGTDDHRLLFYVREIVHQHETCLLRLVGRMSLPS